VAGGFGGFPITMVAKVVPMSVKAFAVVMGHVRCWLRDLNQVEMRTIITMMAVGEGYKPVSLRTRVKEKSSARPGSREYRPPSPRSRDPSHALRWQTRWRRIDCSVRFSADSVRGVIRCCQRSR
jgi:hypothetical protein